MNQQSPGTGTFNSALMLKLYKIKNKPEWSKPFADQSMAVASWWYEGYKHFEVINLNTTNTIFGWEYEPTGE